jgi:hypothetical protein
MSEIVVKAERPGVAGEAEMLARQMAEARRSRIAQLRYELGLSAEEAAAKADEPCPAGRVFDILGRPPDKVTWADLDELANASQQRAADLWEGVKQAALEAVRSGDYAAGVLDGRKAGPFERALFLAVREELADGWQPQNGVERQLTDVAALAQASFFFWHHRLADADTPDEAAEAAEMAERFHKMLVRTLRMLCDLRKGPLAVLVQNAAQVNVGQQQVNVRGGGRKRRRKVRHAPCDGGGAEATPTPLPGPEAQRLAGSTAAGANGAPRNGRAAPL